MARCNSARCTVPASVFPRSLTSAERDASSDSIISCTRTSNNRCPPFARLATTRRKSFAADAYASSSPNSHSARAPPLRLNPPPTFGLTSDARSYTTTSSIPRRRSAIAAARPLGPPPTTAMRFLSQKSFDADDDDARACLDAFARRNLARERKRAASRPRSSTSVSASRARV